MKIAALLLYLIFITVNLSADKNWIPIELADKDNTPQENTQLDINPSQTEPINKIMKNVMLIKHLIDNTKKEKSVANDKNWFELENMENK